MLSCNLNRLLVSLRERCVKNSSASHEVCANGNSGELSSALANGVRRGWKPIWNMLKFNAPAFNLELPAALVRRSVRTQ